MGDRFTLATSSHRAVFELQSVAESCVSCKRVACAARECSITSPLVRANAFTDARRQRTRAAVSSSRPNVALNTSKPVKLDHRRGHRRQHGVKPYARWGIPAADGVKPLRRSPCPSCKGVDPAERRGTPPSCGGQTLSIEGVSQPCPRNDRFPRIGRASREKPRCSGRGSCVGFARNLSNAGTRLLETDGKVFGWHNPTAAHYRPA